jgi:hypothetical protein
MRPTMWARAFQRRLPGLAADLDVGLGQEISSIDSSVRRTASVRACMKVMIDSKVPAGSRSTP